MNSAMTNDVRSSLYNHWASLKSLARKAGAYTFFSALNKSIPFLLLPILTKYLSPSDYGMVAMFSILVVTLMPIIGACSNTILLQRYFKSSVAERQQLLASSYVVMVFVSIALVLLVFLFSGELTALLKLPRDWLLVAILASLMGMVFTMLSTLLQIRQEVTRFGLMQLAQTILNTGLSLLFVVYLGYGWQGRISGITVAFSLMMILGLYLNLKARDFEAWMLIRPRKVAHLVKNGALLVPAALTGAFMMMSDRFILASVISLKQLGIYAAAITLCQIADVIFRAIGMAIAPILMQKLISESDDAKSKALLLSYGLILGYAAIAAFLAMLAPYLVKYMLNDRYHSAAEFVVWIAFAYAFMASGRVFKLHLIAKEKNRTIMLTSFAMFAVFLVINYSLIQMNGALGAAQGVLLSSMIFLGMNIAFSVKYFGFP